MNDDFDAQVEAWLRERARPDPRALAAVRGSIDALPARGLGRARTWWREAAAVLVIALVVAATFAVLAPRPSATTPSRPVPPDPAAFAGDPRLAACFANAGPVEFAFEMAHARDYQRHLPKMLLAPELDVEDAAFVVVFERGAQLRLPLTGTPTASGGPTDAASVAGDPRTVCILVADTPNVYENVDITGMQAKVGDDATPTSSPTAATTPSSTAIRPTTPPSDPPTPSWIADLTGQLECDGKASTTGGEVGHVPFESGSALSPTAAIAAFLRDTLHTDIPTGGYALTDLEGHYARFAYATDGKVKAIVILSDQGPDQEPGVWTPTGLRACNPAEFGPDASSNQLPIWLDRNGARVPTTTILESQGPEHCGWESTTWLRYAGRLYIRDPDGVLADHIVRSFDGDATLPAGATSTGYHDGGRTIWRTSNRDSIFVVFADHAERWPAASPDLGCA